jgi:hypothetical protein
MPKKIFFSNYSTSQNDRKIRNKVQKPVKKTFKPKEGWNTYLTDISEFKLTPQELMKKKEMLLSRNNVLNDSSTEISKVKVVTNKTVSDTKIDIDPNHSKNTNITRVTSEKELKNKNNYNNNPSDFYPLSSVPLQDSDIKVNSSNLSNKISKPIIELFDNKSSSPRKKSLTPTFPKSCAIKSNINTSTDSIYQDMKNQIQGLLEELRNYEQIAGKRSCFDSEVLLQSKLKYFIYYCNMLP